MTYALCGHVSRMLRLGFLVAIETHLLLYIGVTPKIHYTRSFTTAYNIQQSFCSQC